MRFQILGWPETGTVAGAVRVDVAIGSPFGQGRGETGDVRLRVVRCEPDRVQFETFAREILVEPTLRT